MENLLGFFWIIIRLSLVIAECNDTTHCNWTIDGSESLNWITEISEGKNYLRVQRCTYPRCGSATIASPHLQLAWEKPFQFAYKIYGDNRVFLRLSKRVDNNDGTMTISPLWEKWADWGNTIPSQWTNITVLLPPSNYELVFETYIPFSEAFVAIKGINLKGRTPFSYSPQVAEDDQKESPTDDNYIGSAKTDMYGDSMDNEDYEDELDNEIFTSHTSVVIPKICSSFDMVSDDSESHNGG